MNESMALVKMNPQTSAIHCKICDSETLDFGEAKVMGKHKASYQQCRKCGFIFAREPYWLPKKPTVMPSPPLTWEPYLELIEIR